MALRNLSLGKTYTVWLVEVLNGVFMCEIKDVVIIDDMIQSVAAPTCSFNVSLGLLIQIRAANEIRFSKEFGQWGFSKFELQPIELLDT